MATACPRILFGNISDINTQQIGPHDIIKEAVKIMMKINVPIPITFENAMKATPTIPTAIPTEPNIKRGLRPHLSTVKIAKTVNITLTNPITIVRSEERREGKEEESR